MNMIVVGQNTLMKKDNELRSRTRTKEDSDMQNTHGDKQASMEELMTWQRVTNGSWKP